MTVDSSVSLDLNHVRQRTLLALQMAGFDVTPVPHELLSGVADESFELAFERADGGEVVLAYNGEQRQFEIQESLSAELTADRMELALMLNASLRHGQRAGLWPQSGRLFVESVLPEDEADISALASELNEVARWAQTVATAVKNVPSEGSSTEPLLMSMNLKA